MIRYAGQPLPQKPRIAVFANDAIGNFVMATPLLQLLRAERNPARLDYFGGTRTRELQRPSDLFDNSYELLGAGANEVLEILARRGSWDLLINLESTAFLKTCVGLLAGEESYVAGPCIGPGGRGDLTFASDDRGDLWKDNNWKDPDLKSRFSFLQSGFIADIFCRLAYLEGPLPRYRVPCASPERDVPDILIATAASLPEKLWSYASWQKAIRLLREQGLSVGLLGAPPRSQTSHWHGGEDEESLIGESLAEDLRGKLSLPQVVGSLARAKLVLTLDNGILHLAVAAQAPTIGIYRHDIAPLWAPPFDGLTVVTSGSADVPVRDIPVETVLEAVRRGLGEKA